jgi:hypothetical protein
MKNEAQPNGRDIALAVRLFALVVFLFTLATAAKVWLGVVWWVISSLTFQHGVMSLIDVALRGITRFAVQGGSQGEPSMQGAMMLIVTAVNAIAACMVYRKQGAVFTLARFIRRARS